MKKQTYDIWVSANEKLYEPETIRSLTCSQAYVVTSILRREGISYKEFQHDEKRRLVSKREYVINRKERGNVHIRLS
jgi:hypothetical protein